MGDAGAGGQVDAYVDSVEDLVQALQQDPVNVQQVRGNGHTAEVDAEITQIVGSSEVPMFVALVGELPGLARDNPARDLIVRLESRLDREGVYVVAVGDTGPVWEVVGGERELKDAIQAGLAPTYPDYDDQDAPRASDAGGVAIIASVVAAEDHTISDDVVSTYTESATWGRDAYQSPSQAALPSEVAGLSLVLGTLVALVGWRLARTWELRAVVPAPPRTVRPAREPRTTPATTSRPTTTGVPEIEDVRRDATDALGKLAGALVDRPTGPGVEDALGCRIAAELLLDSTDHLDVIGALVLSRTGQSFLRDPDHHYRPCFVNPLHGQGLEEIDVTADGTVFGVPCCRRCAGQRSLTPRANTLLARPSGWWRRAPRPYYEDDTVWSRTGFGALDPTLWRRVIEDRS